MGDSLVAIHERSPVFLYIRFYHNEKGNEVQQSSNVVNFPNCVHDVRDGSKSAPTDIYTNAVISTAAAFNDSFWPC